MKTILLAFAGALVATTALAQSAAPPDRPGRDSYDRRDSSDRRDSYDRGDRRGDREGGRRSWFEEFHPPMDEMHSQMMGRGRMGMMGGERMGMRQGGGRGEEGSGGAHFRFQRGDQRIDIRCGDESMSQCVEAATRLIDKVMSARPAGGGDASLPAPAPATAAPALPGAGAPDSLPRPQ
jgi:hypothetical protein